jgi:hypothetical protein
MSLLVLPIVLSATGVEARGAREVPLRGDGDGCGDDEDKGVTFALFWTLKAEVEMGKNVEAGGMKSVRLGFALLCGEGAGFEVAVRDERVPRAIGRVWVRVLADVLDEGGEEERDGCTWGEACGTVVITPVMVHRRGLKCETITLVDTEATKIG